MLIIEDKFDFNDDVKYIHFYVDVMCKLYKLNLSRGAKMLITYYILYGIDKSTHKKFIADKRGASINFVFNLRTELGRWNVLVKEKDNYKLSEHFDIKMEDSIGFKLLFKYGENSDRE